MRLGLQNLLQDRLRFALSVVGIALSVMLILFLLGLRQGFLDGVTAYLSHTPGSVVVMPQAVKNTLSGSTGQYLASETSEIVAGTPGVGRVIPILQTRAMPELHGKKQSVMLVGYDAALGGGPWDVAQGRYPVADDEVVLDRVLADRHDVALSDIFELGGVRLTVVGLSNGTASYAQSFVFARKATVESLLLAPGASSFLLVTPAPGISQAELVSNLQQRLPRANVLLKSAVMTDDQEVMAGIMDQVIFLMVAAAFIVGALVVGMVLYTATIERRSEYGILKAIGARGGVLYRVVLAQALVADGLGVLVGIGFAFAMGWLVTTLKPQFLITIQPAAIAVTVGVGLVMALLGALLPARSVVSLAPADVFRR